MITKGLLRQAVSSVLSHEMTATGLGGGHFLLPKI